MSNRKRPPSAGGDVDAQRLTSGVDDDALGGRAAGNRHSARRRFINSDTGGLCLQSLCPVALVLSQSNPRLRRYPR